MPEQPRKIIKRDWLFIFVVDTSEDMEKCSKMNKFLNTTISRLKERSQNNITFDLKVAVLTFNTTCQWMMHPVGIEDFNLEKLVVGGLANLGIALKELNECLSENGKKAIMNNKIGHFRPVIIYVGCKNPTDDWYSVLEVLKENGWYKTAIKILLSMGRGTGDEVYPFLQKNKALIIENNKEDVLIELLNQKVGAIINEYSKMSGEFLEERF